MVPEVSTIKKKIPTRLDRYPAKMVSHLAEKLIEKYASDCKSLLDPFCGSGAILVAAQRKGIPVTGIDINPYAALITGVKINGFPLEEAKNICHILIDRAKACSLKLPIMWDLKRYWFTDATIEKYERLRYVAKNMQLYKTHAGRVVLLALALSVRLCSRADQRSPKPFISKTARLKRKGRHFNPYTEIALLLEEIGSLHSAHVCKTDSNILIQDLTDKCLSTTQIGVHTHVITSPPYINAQDYYRNFKLELYILEGIISFDIDLLRKHFIGTERGDLMRGISERQVEKHYRLVPRMKALEKSSKRHAAIVHRYLCNMEKAFNSISHVLQPNGVFVIVCGDNLVGGFHIRTWAILNSLLMERGFKLFDQFSDTIMNRMLPPQRQGHKGLIKEEMVSAFRLRRVGN